MKQCVGRGICWTAAAVLPLLHLPDMALLSHKEAAVKCSFEFILADYKGLL